MVVRSESVEYNLLSGGVEYFGDSLLVTYTHVQLVWTSRSGVFVVPMSVYSCLVQPLSVASHLLNRPHS